jgi:hypothetical protein
MNKRRREAAVLNGGPAQTTAAAVLRARGAVPTMVAGCGRSGLPIRRRWLGRSPIRKQ